MADTAVAEPFLMKPVTSIIIGEANMNEQAYKNKHILLNNLMPSPLEISENYSFEICLSFIKY